MLVKIFSRVHFSRPLARISPSSSLSQDFAVDKDGVVQPCLCLTAFYKFFGVALQTRWPKSTCVRRVYSFWVGCCYVCVCAGGVARVSGVFHYHQRRQACVSVCQRCGRMRNSLSVCGACVHVLFGFVRSFGLLSDGFGWCSCTCLVSG